VGVGPVKIGRARTDKPRRALAGLTSDSPELSRIAIERSTIGVFSYISGGCSACASQGNHMRAAFRRNGERNGWVRASESKSRVQVGTGTSATPMSGTQVGLLPPDLKRFGRGGSSTAKSSRPPLLGRPQKGSGKAKAAHLVSAKPEIHDSLLRKKPACSAASRLGVAALALEKGHSSMLVICAQSRAGIKRMPLLTWLLLVHVARRSCEITISMKSNRHN